MTKIDVWNMALAMLPHDRPVFSEDDGSLEAKRCSQHWDGARMAVFTAREWGWLVEEAPPCNARERGGGFFTEEPQDALLSLGLYRDGRRVRAEAVNGGFRAKEPFDSIRYLRDETDPGRWPVAILDAVVAELAARIAPVMTANARRAAELRQDAIARLEEASRQDAMRTAWDGSDPLVFVHARR